MPPASIMAGPPIAKVVSSVAMITSQHATNAVLPAKHLPDTTPTIGTNPLNCDQVVNVVVSIPIPDPSSPGLPPPPSPNRTIGNRNLFASS